MSFKLFTQQLIYLIDQVYFFNNLSSEFAQLIYLTKKMNKWE